MFGARLDNMCMRRAIRKAAWRCAVGGGCVRRCRSASRKVRGGGLAVGGQRGAERGRYVPGRVAGAAGRYAGVMLVEERYETGMFSSVAEVSRT